MEAELQPEDPEQAAKDVKAAQKAVLKATGAQAQWVDPLTPVTLGTVEQGSTFSPADVVHKAELWPPGVAGPAETPQEAREALARLHEGGHGPPPMAGTRQLYAKPQGGVPAEVLYMGRPMYGMTLSGGSRAVPAQEVARLLQKLGWAPALWAEGEEASGRSPSRKGQAAEEVARKLAGRCRVEEVTQVCVTVCVEGGVAR